MPQQASSAQLDPLDAVNVIANRGAGAKFYSVAQAFRYIPLQHIKIRVEMSLPDSLKQVLATFSEYALCQESCRIGHTSELCIDAVCAMIWVSLLSGTTWAARPLNPQAASGRSQHEAPMQRSVGPGQDDPRAHLPAACHCRSSPCQRSSGPPAPRGLYL